MFSCVRHFYKSTTCINSINLHNILGSYYYHHHFSDDEIKAQNKTKTPRFYSKAQATVLGVQDFKSRQCGCIAQALCF